LGLSLAYFGLEGLLMEKLLFSLEDREGIPIFRLKGRIDTTTAPILEKEIEKFLKEGKNSILLDCEKINYLSSTGLRLLLSTAQKLKRRGGQLILFQLTPLVLEIVHMAGFDKILAIYPTEKEGLQALN
jgi:anti-sigma B factor antagonist